MWIEYERMGGSDLCLEENTVSISQRGSMGIARNLNRPEMVDHFGRPAYDPDRKLLRITLTKERANAYCFREEAPRMRIEPIQAMKDFGILPARRIVCPAWWEGEHLYVQLRGWSCVARDASHEEPAPPAASRTTHTDKRPVWVGKAMCPECGKPVAYRMVDGVPWTRSHKNAQGQACEARGLPETPMTTEDQDEMLGPRSGPAKGPSHDASSPSPDEEGCICRACGQILPVVRRSDGVRPMAHRVDGKICPGVFEPADD